MNRKRRSHAERREATREQLLQATATVFARRSYHGASVAEAGCSTGALYAHFTSKTDLFLALFDREMPDWAVGYAGAVASTTSIDNALEATGQVWEQLLDTNPVKPMLFIEFWCAAMRDPQIKPEFANREDRVRATMTSLITLMQNTLDTHTSIAPAELSTIVIALADGLALQRLITPDSVPVDLFVTALRLVFGAAITQKSQPLSRGNDDQPGPSPETAR
jgi:AcrR family transcriptional regulator